MWEKKEGEKRGEMARDEKGEVVKGRDKDGEEGKRDGKREGR